MDLQALYTQVKQSFYTANIDNADWEARFLLKYALKIDDSDFITSKNTVFDQKACDLVQIIIQKRLEGVPVGIITGATEFWGLPIKVNEYVLEPRADSETIIEAVLRRFGKNTPQYFLDLGTGSACLPIALLSEWTDAKALAVDISVDALEVAVHNVKLNNVSERITFKQGDWFEALSQDSNFYISNEKDLDVANTILPQKFDLIISNPPYISNQEISNLAIEVQNHDPILALDGGADGLNEYKKIISSLKNYLSATGFCFLEIGYDQSDSVSRIVENAGLYIEAIHADLAGHPRVVEISFGENMQK